MNNIIIVLSILLFLTSLFIILLNSYYYFFFPYPYPHYKIISLSEINHSNHSNYKIIPKILIQTVLDKSKIPEKVFQNINKYASDFKHVIFENNDCIKFIKENYPSQVLETFHRLKNGAHKADLFRYCYLYINGGLYADIKTEFIKPVSSVFFRNKLTIVLATPLNVVKTIYNGVIYTQPRHPIFLELISHMIEISKHKFYHYLIFCKHFFDILNKYNDEDYYLLNEKCSIMDSSKCHDGFDKRGVCSNIYDKDEIVIKTRYSDYPW